MLNIMSRLNFTRTLGSAVMLGIMLFLSLPAATYALVPSPTLSLTANPIQVGTGGTATLSWTSQNTTSCTASGGWSGSKGTSGSQTVNITSDRTYNLTCAGTMNISASVKVWVVSPPPPPPPVQPALKPFSGVNGALWGGVDPVKAVDAMKNAGFNSMRDGLNWSLLEKKKGVFAWPSELARQRKAVSLQQGLGMKPLVILSYGNGALYPGTGKSQVFIDGFTRYAKWLATELKGSVRHFEVWNEWNGGIGLPCTYQNPQGICTGEAYAKLLCPVYAALKQVDPSIVVVGGAIAGGLDNRFIDGMIAGGGMKCLDVLSLHLYRYWRFNEPAEVTLSKLQSLQNRIKPIVGKEIPFYITETGVPVYPGSKHTLDEQADYHARFHLAAKAFPFIQGIWPFSLTDVNARNLLQGSFGLMYRNVTPKPAYHAMQDVTGLFSESEFLGKVKSASDIWLLKLREPNGSSTYTVWSTSTRTSTKLIFNAPVAGTLNIQKAGSDPIAVTKASFKAGSNAINVAVSSTPRIIWASGASINITEAAK